MTGTPSTAVPGTHQHTATTGGDGVPRPILLAAAALLAFSMAFAFIARQTDLGATRLQPAPAVESRDISFLTEPDGNLAIRDVKTGQTLQTLTAASDGFIKIVLRSVVQERKLSSVEPDAPVRLSRLTDGQLHLLDPSTGRIVVLSAFGPGNEAVFASLLSR